MRSKNSIYNAIFSMISNMVTILIGLVAQKIFLKTLGNEYLGLNSLFSNILSMLAVVEVGIGSAIIFNLYKPIAEKDFEKVKSLMKFYKKSYSIIAGIVLGLGIILLPFLKIIIGEININVNIYFAFALFLLDTICSYLLTYKRSILYVNQKNYIVSIVHTMYTVLLNTFQIIFLIFTGNYYLYLIVKVIMRIVENIVITLISEKLYPYIKEKNVLTLDKNIEKDIFKKVKALLFHKIGTFMVLGTDNILITKFFGLVITGMYSNYYLIINALDTILLQAFQNITSSIGNVVAVENSEKQYNVFQNVRFVNFIMSTFCSCCLFNLIQPFIKLWIGEEYLMSIGIVLILCINFYLKTMRATFTAFQDAAGIYYENRYVPIIESLLNILFSIIFAKCFGLIGIFIGTLVSSFALWFYSFPKFVYTNLFKRNYFEYYKEFFMYIFIFAVIMSITYLSCTLINFNNVIITMTCNLCTTVIIFTVIIFFLFKNSNYFSYYLNVIKNFAKKK